MVGVASLETSVKDPELLYAYGRDAKRRGREMSRQLEAHL